MREEYMVKVLAVVMISIALSWVICSRDRAEKGRKCGNDRQRYLPYLAGYLLPLFLVVVAGLSMVCYGIQVTAQMTLSMCFRIFVHISIYYAMLILVLRFLRRHIRARTCAMLWLIPTSLYFTEESWMEVSKPLLVIHMPEKMAWVLFFLWMLGFSVVLIWKFISHVSFRSHILRDAVTVTDPAILELWQSEIERAQIREPKFKLVVSPKTTTPLSIGLFGSTTQVVLPKRSYTSEELMLIFRHEIIHIGRKDAWAKFFLVFCTAMCWFNPLMWIAMRKSAEDLELSCDETVLLDSDDETRYQYAELILDTAGDERGFTTCLSTSVSAVRYRLKNIAKPQKRSSGAMTVGVIFFVLCMSYGYVALTYGRSTGAEVIFQSRDSKTCTLKYATEADDLNVITYTCKDRAAFHEYMSKLSMEQLTGNYSFTGDGRQIELVYQTPEGILSIDLSDHGIKLVPLYGEKRAISHYYLREGVNWEYLDTLLVPSVFQECDVCKDGMFQIMSI